jgi:hypothetical protein
MDEARLNRSDVELLVAAHSDSEAFGEFYRRHGSAATKHKRLREPKLS